MEWSGVAGLVGRRSCGADLKNWARNLPAARRESRPTGQAAISLENTRLYSELEEREAKIRRLVDANIMGVFIWNLQGEIIEANEAFLHMVQCSREDLVSGRVRWTDLTPAEWRHRDERAVAEAKATGTVQPREKEYLRKDGSRVPVLVGAALFEGIGNEGALQEPGLRPSGSLC